MPYVLSLFDYSTVMVQPWLRAGWNCICVDLQHPHGETKKDNLTLIGADLLEWRLPELEYHIVFGFPPCTHLAVSGARWFASKGEEVLAGAIALVQKCETICLSARAPYCIENPVGRLSTYWKKPNYIFDPCDFAGYRLKPGADRYLKRTCLWTGAGFKFPQPKYLWPCLYSKMHTISPGPERANQRSKTPLGFSKAVYEYNK